MAKLEKSQRTEKPQSPKRGKRPFNPNEKPEDRFRRVCGNATDKAVASLKTIRRTFNREASILHKGERFENVYKSQESERLKVLAILKKYVALIEKTHETGSIPKGSKVSGNFFGV